MNRGNQPRRRRRSETSDSEAENTSSDTECVPAVEDNLWSKKLQSLIYQSFSFSANNDERYLQLAKQAFELVRVAIERCIEKNDLNEAVPLHRALFIFMPKFYLSSHWFNRPHEAPIIEYVSCLLSYLIDLSLMIKDQNFNTKVAPLVLRFLTAYQILDILLNLKAAKEVTYHLLASIICRILSEIQLKGGLSNRVYVKCLILARRSLILLNSEAKQYKEISVIVKRFKRPETFGTWYSGLEIRDLPTLSTGCTSDSKFNERFILRCLTTEACDQLLDLFQPALSAAGLSGIQGRATADADQPLTDDDDSEAERNNRTYRRINKVIEQLPTEKVDWRKVYKAKKRNPEATEEEQQKLAIEISSDSEEEEELETSGAAGEAALDDSMKEPDAATDAMENERRVRSVKSDPSSGGVNDGERNEAADADSDIEVVPTVADVLKSACDLQATFTAVDVTTMGMTVTAVSKADAVTTVDDDGTPSDSVVEIVQEGLAEAGVKKEKKDDKKNFEVISISSTEMSPVPNRRGRPPRGISPMPMYKDFKIKVEKQNVSLNAASPPRSSSGKPSMAGVKRAQPNEKTPKAKRACTNGKSVTGRSGSKTGQSNHKPSVVESPQSDSSVSSELPTPRSSNAIVKTYSRLNNVTPSRNDVIPVNNGVTPRSNDVIKANGVPPKRSNITRLDESNLPSSDVTPSSNHVTPVINDVIIAGESLRRSGRRTTGPRSYEEEDDSDYTPKPVYKKRGGLVRELSLLSIKTDRLTRSSDKGQRKKK